MRLEIPILSLLSATWLYKVRYTQFSGAGSPWSLPMILYPQTTSPPPPPHLPSLSFPFPSLLRRNMRRVLGRIRRQRRAPPRPQRLHHLVELLGAPVPRHLLHVHLGDVGRLDSHLGVPRDGHGGHHVPRVA